jgi:hypothetical protein
MLLMKVTTCTAFAGSWDELELLEPVKNFSYPRMLADATLIVISATHVACKEQKKALGGRNSSAQLMQQAGALP